MNAADLNHVARLRSVNHLAATNVNTSMMVVDADIAWLWIAHARPPLDSARGAPVVTHFARKAVTHQARAVKAIRTSCSPLIWLTQLSICTINNNVARYRLRL